MFFADMQLWCYLSETHYLTRLRRRDLRLSDITTWLSSKLVPLLSTRVGQLVKTTVTTAVIG